MPTLFKNKYRVDSTRMKGWDYSHSGYYFVTICAKDCKCYFGKVAEDKVILSNIGKIVSDEWLKTKDIRENVVLDEMVIMPNHLHVISYCVKTRF
ncbi:MAG: hypothetical protein ABIC82_03645 [bacterium]